MLEANAGEEIVDGLNGGGAGGGEFLGLLGHVSILSSRADSAREVLGRDGICRDGAKARFRAGLLNSIRGVFGGRTGWRISGSRGMRPGLAGVLLLGELNC
jgi:hypothetical protein